MNKYKKGFTILELIFVIVIIGILSSIALPRLFSVNNDAVKTKLKTEFQTIKAGIASKYTQLTLQGKDECPKLEKLNTDDFVFEGVLMGPIPKNDNYLKWDGNGTDYNVTYQGQTIHFSYDNNIDNGCIFSCVSPTNGEFSCKLFR
jgi:general secretion pathway protein G